VHSPSASLFPPSSLPLFAPCCDGSRAVWYGPCFKRSLYFASWIRLRFLFTALGVLLRNLLRGSSLELMVPLCFEAGGHKGFLRIWLFISSMFTYTGSSQPSSLSSSKSSLLAAKPPTDKLRLPASGKLKLVSDELTSSLLSGTKVTSLSLSSEESEPTSFFTCWTDAHLCS